MSSILTTIEASDSTDAPSNLFIETMRDNDYRFLTFMSVTTETGVPDIVSPTWKHEFSMSYQSGDTQSLYTSDGVVIFVGSAVRNNTVAFRVAGKSSAHLEAVTSFVKDKAPSIKVSPDEDPRINFWSASAHGPTNRARKIGAQSWSDIERNYPFSTRQQVGNLMALRPPIEGGRLILWHGNPGTGKSHAIRALAREWMPWCDMHYMVDPEALFGSAAYLMNILFDGGHADVDFEEPDIDADPHIFGSRGRSPALSGNDRWRVLVMEDADEFLVSDAKQRTGQALSRLLNTADGMIGQGLKVLVLITTNEPLDNIHAAVQRPGRCIANTSFAEFTVPEATEWMGSRVGQKHSLASLYDLKRDDDKQQIGTPPALVSTGQYL